MNHDELMEIVPAYALDAVSQDEEMQLRAHFTECRECAGLFEAHLETAAMLALSAEPLAGSASLRERVLAAAANEGQVRSIPSPAQWAPARKPWAQRIAALAAAAAFLFAVLGGWMALRLRDQNELLGKQEQALGLIASAGVDVVPMRGDGAEGQIFIPEDGAQAAVLVKGLKDPGDKSYALWLIRDSGPVPIQNFEPDKNGQAVLLVERGVSASSVMAITLEPQAGTTQPLGPKVLST